MPKAGKQKFYAVVKGRVPGIYDNWPECSAQVNGVPNIYQSFSTRAEALQYLEEETERIGGAPVAASSSSAGRSISKPRSSAKSTSSRPTSRAKPPSKSAVKKDPSPLLGFEGDDETGWDVVYTDGACSNNQNRGRAVGGVGVWWGPNDPRNLSERCPGEQTNNRAEIIAIVRAMEMRPPTKGAKLRIKTDSNYAIRCVTEWLPDWCYKNRYIDDPDDWTKGLSKQPVEDTPQQQDDMGADEGDVPAHKPASSKPQSAKTNAPPSPSKKLANARVLAYLGKLIQCWETVAGQRTLKFVHVRGHQGVEGNEYADRLAVAGCHFPALEEVDWNAKRTALNHVIELRFSTRHSGSGSGSGSEVALLVPPPNPTQMDVEIDQPSQMHATATVEAMLPVAQPSQAVEPEARPADDDDKDMYDVGGDEYDDLDESVYAALETPHQTPAKPSASTAQPADDEFDDDDEYAWMGDLDEEELQRIERGEKV